MARSSYDYTQTGIGDCGHVVNTWPQITDIGGGNPTVICDDCTRALWDLDPSETLHVWVALKPKPSPVKPKVKREPKPKKLSPMQALLQEEGLF